LSSLFILSNAGQEANSLLAGGHLRKPVRAQSGGQRKQQVVPQVHQETRKYGSCPGPMDPEEKEKAAAGAPHVLIVRTPDGRLTWLQALASRRKGDVSHRRCPNCSND